MLPTDKKGSDGAADDKSKDQEAKEIVLGFEKPTVWCQEDCGHVSIVVTRSGMLDQTCLVHFDTSDGTAVCGEDYIHNSGVLEFKAQETSKTIDIEVIDDNEWEPDEHFFVRLLSPHSNSGDAMRLTMATCQVWIIDNDNPGKVGFESKTVTALETDNSVTVKLVRNDGHDGNVLVFLKTVEGTAKANENFIPLSDDTEVHFAHGVSEGEVTVNLKHNPDNTNATFTLMITSIEPEGATISDSMCTVIISNDKEYQALMQNVVALMDEEMGKYNIGSSSWGEQFHDAMNMAGDEDAEPEFGDYLMHFLSFYWKVVHALVPPTDYYGGWATFWVSLAFIGMITMFVGDMAKMLGCTIGVEDSITAITFVALGTSLPDTFASVEATCSDDTADAAITNVTGSNSVNVFLGLGLPWIMASVYHAINGTTYVYKSGDLVFSVLTFSVFAVVCIGMLLGRRFSYVNGELGGPKSVAYGSSFILVVLWIGYVLVSAMKTKGYI